MQKLLLLLSTIFSLVLSANTQTDINQLLGDWEVVSFEETGMSRNTANIYFRIVFESAEEVAESGDVAGDFVMDQVKTENGQEKCYCSGLVFLWPETHELEIDFVVSCSDQDPESELASTSACDYWVGSDKRYAIQLNQNILSLQNAERKIVLRRR
jgi:hypothetical protein